VLRHFGQQKIYKAAATEDTSRTEHGKTPQNNKKIQTDLTQTQTNKTWTGKTKKNKERETTGKQMAAGKSGEKDLRVFVCVCVTQYRCSRTRKTASGSTICTCHSLSATEPQPDQMFAQLLSSGVPPATCHLPPAPCHSHLKGVAPDLGQWDIPTYTHTHLYPKCI